VVWIIKNELRNDRYNEIRAKMIGLEVGVKSLWWEEKNKRKFISRSCSSVRREKEKKNIGGII
jgi:hypothetical protein